jgi:hypothetical protein
MPLNAALKEHAQLIYAQMIGAYRGPLAAAPHDFPALAQLAIEAARVFEQAAEKE